MRNLARVIDALMSGVIVVDGGGIVREMNGEACRILETSAESARQQPVEGALGPPLGKLVRAALASGRARIENEIRIERRYATSPLIVEIALSPIHDLSGGAEGVVVEIRDRSIQRELREAAFERERMSAFGRIAAGIAHEVKNPLGGIRGAAEIVAKRSEDGRFIRAAELVIRETDRIAGLLDDFLVLGHDGSLRLRSLNLHRVLDDVLDLNDLDPLSDGIRIERRYDPSIPELRADRDRLAQVFHNLVRNALQAMAGGNGDRLEIRTRVDLDHPLASGDGPRRPAVSVEVIDAGPGIADEDRERIADPFFTTRETGTGLGLSIAQHWVGAHGGRLVLSSAEGEGTCARVTLPLQTTRSPA